MGLMLCGIVASGTRRPEHVPDFRRLEVGDWTALALSVDTGPAPDPEADAQRMLDWADRQNRLLCGYVAFADVLPVALGAVFSGDQALCAHLRAEREGIAARLAPLTGRVELGLQLLETAADLPSPPEPEAGGRSYLLARRLRRDQRTGRARARRALTQTLSEGLDGAVVSVRRRPPRDPSRLADWALLVEREALADLASWLGTHKAAALAADTTLRLIGPMPAFSFCVDHEVAA